MVLQKIEADLYKNRYLSEDMRSNKEVWIDEYSKQALSDEEHQNIIQTALKVKSVYSSHIAHIHDVIEDDDIIYIISHIPKGKKLHPFVNCNEKTVYMIALRLIQALLTLQRLDIKVYRLLPEQVYIDINYEVQLLFERGMFLQSDQKSGNEEIKSIGRILYFLILGEMPNDFDNVEEKLKAHCSDSLSNLVLRMLSDEDSQKFQRLEQIIPLLEEKREIDTDSIVLSNNIEVTVSHKIYRSLIIIFAAVFLYSGMYDSKSFALEEISAFDKVRFHVLGYLGSKEAQRVLGEIYEKGYGVEQNYQESIQWYKKAAQSGNIYSQMSLGHFYDQGIGVAIDKKQALYWFTLAAANGDEIAKHNIEIIEQKSSEIVNHKNEKSDGQIQNAMQQQQLENEKSNYISQQHYFHTYWVHSGSSNNLRKSDQFGGIYGCYENGLKNPIELVSFNHEVRSMAVDGDGNLYWADITTGQIVKADPNGQNSRPIVSRLSYPMGITIDKKRKLLFWCDRQKNAGGYSGGIGRSDLEGKGAKYIVVNDLRSGGKLKVDENEAKIYIPDISGKKIVRVNEDGNNMIGLVFSIKPEGFDIDPQRRKMYWTDDMNSGIYESDYDGRNKRIVYTYYTTDENFETVMFNPRDQRVYFGKLGPGSQSIGSASIYDEHSARLQEYVTNFKIHDIIRN